MDTLNGTSQLKTARKGLILLIVLALATAASSGADRITEPGQDTLLGPGKPAAPQQQIVDAPPRFGPARPSTESPAAFTPEMPFAQAIDILRNSVRPPLNLVVLWREIEENAGVDRNTQIGIDSLQGVSARQCLEILLNSLSATAVTKIGYTVDHGVIIVATVDSLPTPKRVTRVYDISDLVAPPSSAMGFGMMPGMMPGMTPGFGGGMSYGGYGSGYGGYSPGYGGYGSSYGGYGGYSPGYGGYGMTPGYNSAGGLPGLTGNFRGMGVFGR